MCGQHIIFPEDMKNNLNLLPTIIIILQRKETLPHVQKHIFKNILKGLNLLLVGG